MGRPVWYDRSEMVKAYTRLAVIFGLAALFVATLGAQDRPLPDQETFLKETRKHLQTDSSVQRSYMYVETQRVRKLDKDGRIAEESIKVYESYPGLPGEPRWERLISEDGKPVAANKLADQDSDRTKKATAMAKRLENDPGKERARQQRDWDEAHHERSEAVDDLYVDDAIHMTGRERVEGHDTIAFRLTPRPDSKPKTREGDLMKIIWHDGVGMSLYAKRLEAGKFIWPVSQGGTAVQISAAQLGYLLEGIDWRNPRWTQRPAKAG